MSLNKSFFLLIEKKSRISNKQQTELRTIRVIDTATRVTLFCGTVPEICVDNWRSRSVSGVLEPKDSSRRLNSRAMFEHGPKRHSYQLWEVKFQCPAKESTVETDQRLSKELARYILPSGVPSSPSQPLKSILTCVLCQTVLRSLCPSSSSSPSLSAVSSAFPRLSSSLSSLPYKLN